MTTPTFPAMACPDGPNYAAIAQQMKQTALDAEQRIFALEKTLRAAVNRPTIVQTSTAIITDLFSGLTYEIGPASGTGSFVTNFNNTGSDHTPDSTLTAASGLGEGLYQIGFYANVIASGAVNDNTYRAFAIRLGRPDPTAPNGVTDVIASEVVLYETNTGVGVDCCVVATFRIRIGDRIRFEFGHGNSSSPLNASAGTMIWLSKVSSPDSVVTL